MPILCNCCNTDNAPMAKHKSYLICDDCVERYGSYDNAALICLARNTFGLDLVPEELLDELDELYEHYMKMNFPDKAGGTKVIENG